jgi:monoamine oxidase
MGAMWIHGASKNIMNRLALNYDVETHMSTYSTRIYKEDNQGPFEEEEVESYREQIYQDGFFPFQAARQESTECDEPLQKSADLFVDQLNSPFEQQLARLFLKSSIEIEYSGLLRDHSLWWWNDDYDLGGTIEFDDYFVPEGHNSLIGPFASQLLSDHKIQLEAPVQTIDYQSKDLIEVSYNNKDGNDNLARTRKVIVTVPLGVLKAESITFVPRLPRWAQRSIRRLGMGKMNKVFLFWSSDNVFWPYDTEILGDITERDSNFLFCNPRPYNGNLPMLFAFFQGPTADRLEEEYAESDPVMYKDRIRDLAMESLRSMFGDDIPMPQKVVVTQWNVDEYTGGAYSFNQVGMGRHDRHLLAQPIGRNQIFIAGEATHSRYFATTTGAFLTGRAAARKAIQALQKD